MQLIILISSFALLWSMACALSLWPLNLSLFKKILFVLTTFVLVGGGYMYWGQGILLNQFWQQAQKQQQAKALLSSLKNPTGVIGELKRRLTQNPNSAEGWYLLGRLYATQNAWKLSKDSFAQAYQLKPDDEKIEVNYAQSLWQANQQRLPKQAHQILQKVLLRNPDEPDALAIVAIAAYREHRYEEAITHWRHLLLLSDPRSEEASMLKRAIHSASKEKTLH